MKSLIRFPKRPSKSLSLIMSGGITYSSIPNLRNAEMAEALDSVRGIGDGLHSSVLTAPLNWLMRTYPEAPVVVERRGATPQQWEIVDPHPLTNLLERPNPFYSGIQLAMATALDLAFGNAYWIKRRNSLGEVVQLWWAPRAYITPRWENVTRPDAFIDYYQYAVDGRTYELKPSDVLHFRFGMDPRNLRLGLSPLGALVRDVALDDYAANFTMSVLKNMGIIGVVISPEAPGPMSKEALKETKEYIEKNFTGANRGKPLAIGAATKVDLLQYNLQGFDVSPLRDVSEERVCAALGIPAAVVGFGTGLQQTKVGATMKEMRQLAWTGGLIPLQRIAAAELNRSLITEPIFDGTAGYAPPSMPGRRRVRYDSKRILALWEDDSARNDRVRADYLAGMISRGEARKETGRGPSDNDDTFVQPVNVQLLGADGKPMPTPPATSATPPAQDPTAPEDV